MIETYQQNVRENISQERKRLQWSYGKLARHVTRAGVQMERNVPWDIEQGTYTVTFEELIAFAKVFQRPVEFFFTDPRMHIVLGPKEMEKLAKALFETFAMRHEEWDEKAWIELAEEIAPTIEHLFDPVPEEHQPISA
jgi:transcriptional regulator with XRE-family HTH domain